VAIVAVVMSASVASERRHHLAVIARGQDALAVAGAGENGAAMDGDADRLARPRREQQRLLAEREDRGAIEEMRADHRGRGRDQPHPVGDRGGAGARHGIRQRIPRSPCGSSPRAVRGR
jgi:hypothetical protein